jgi:hypothetical protein
LQQPEVRTPGKIMKLIDYSMYLLGNLTTYLGRPSVTEETLSKDKSEEQEQLEECTVSQLKEVLKSRNLHKYTFE